MTTSFVELVVWFHTCTNKANPPSFVYLGMTIKAKNLQNTIMKVSTIIHNIIAVFGG